MLDAPERPTDNEIIEKYCFMNAEPYCNNTYGGLYFWNELMDYTYKTGGQGICPDGWHIPDELDWQILEGAVDSTYQIGDAEWDGGGWRGYDAGGALKETGSSHWVSPNDGATDAYGFTALPGGYFVQNDFWGLNYKAFFWSSNNLQKYYRNIDWNQAMVKRGIGGSGLAVSVRCVKDK